MTSPHRVYVAPARVAGALLAASALLTLPSCARDSQAPSPAAEAAAERERAALRAMNALDAALERVRSLHGEERITAERALGPSCDEVLPICERTRLENKAWYLLATWRLQYDPVVEHTHHALDRLERCPLPALKQSGRALRVQALCRQERLPAARLQAEQVVEAVPQFQPVLDLVHLLERRGTSAPELPGLTRPARPVLLIIANDDGEDTRYRVAQLLARPDTTAWTPVLVVFDAAPAVLRDIPSVLRRPDLVTYHPHTAAELAAWQAAWTPPSEFLVSCLDADGRLLATALRVDDPLPPAPTTPQGP